MTIVISSVSLALFTVLFQATAFATCIGVNGIPDYNCDGIVRVTVLGDSLVYGLGDTVNRNRGGYVARSQRKLRQVSFVNLGINGATTQTWLDELTKIFNTNRALQKRTQLQTSDLIVIDLGRNDRWKWGTRVAFTKLRQVVAKLKHEIALREGRAPMVVVSVLMLPNRGSQAPWVKEFNMLLRRAHSSGFIADLRFDLVSKRLLSKDQIHPTSKGYDSIASVLISYLTRVVPPRMRKLMPDTDRDGISNYYELNKFRTDPTLVDTDGDGYSDFQELFRLNRDPLDFLN